MKEIDIIGHVENLRLEASKSLDEDRKYNLRQYFSPSSLAILMASMLNFKGKCIRILDPGAGIGSLFSACVQEIVQKRVCPESVFVTAYEIDRSLNAYLEDTFEICNKACRKAGIKFEKALIGEDFIQHTARRFGLSGLNSDEFDYVIINPPYGRINFSSPHYRILKAINSETPNYYAAFIYLSIRLLRTGGEMVSITPRSFCNGSLFKLFRKRFLANMYLKRIHIFNSRTKSFKQDNVLQENIILCSIKNNRKLNSVMLSSSNSPDDHKLSFERVTYDWIMSPNDPDFFLRIIPDKISRQIAAKMASFEIRLEDLGLEVSTGKVVDFRALEFLRRNPSPTTVPLIHPGNLNVGFVKWPLFSKKPIHIVSTKETKSLLVKNGNYVLTKRFTAKEEKKRIVASILEGSRFDYDHWGFENRVNYFHSYGCGMNILLAKGLTVFLASSMVDLFFRQFNGHTQVNANDLRNLRYPTIEELKSLGRRIIDNFPEQETLDNLVEKELF